MEFRLIGFQVRIRTAAGFDVMCDRVAGALGCGFADPGELGFRSTDGVEAYALGMIITLSRVEAVPVGDEHTYAVQGQTRGDIEAAAPVDVEYQTISEFVAGVLRVIDSADWYIPTRRELLEEAGLTDDGAD